MTPSRFVGLPTLKIARRMGVEQSFLLLGCGRLLSEIYKGYFIRSGNRFAIFILEDCK